MQWIEGNNDMLYYYNTNSGQIYGVVTNLSSCAWRAMAIQSDQHIGDYITKEQAKTAIELFYNSGGR